MSSVDRAYLATRELFKTLHLENPVRRGVAGALLTGGLLFLVRPAFFFRSDADAPPPVSPEVFALLVGGALAVL